MGKVSSLVKRLKHPHHKNGNTNEHHTDNASSSQATVTLDNGSSSVPSIISNSPPFTNQRSAQPSTENLSRETAPSLWHRAYETLRDKDRQLVDRYEELLSRELNDHTTDNDLNNTENRIDGNPDTRQAQLKTIIDQGLQRADEKRTNYTIFGHNFVLRDQVAQAAQLIQAVKGLINEAVKVSPEASIAWAGVCVLLPVLTNPIAAEEANRNGLSYVTSRIRYHVEIERLLWPEALHNSGLKSEFYNHIVDLYQFILQFQMKTVLRFYGEWLANLGRDVIRRDDWKGMLSEIKRLEQTVREESSTVNTIDSRNTLEAINKVAEQQYSKMQSLISVAEEQLVEQRRTNQILEDHPIDLPVVNEARYDSSDVQDSPRCESGTRTRIQEAITQWADEGSGEPLFWLVGPAGTGKSTIARTVASLFAGKNRLVGGYFFKRGEQDRNDTSRLFPTLAMQLADESPPFKSCLRKFLAGLDKDAVEKRSIEIQFDKLLKLPLEDLPPIDASDLPRLFIIDALDECERPEHFSRILALLSKLCCIPSMQLRVLVTSRSDRSIINAFGSLPRNKTARRFDLHLEFPEETKNDIQIFLSTKFTDIRTKCGIQQDPWPTAEELGHLVRLATNPTPLFIYAATVCRFVYDEHNLRSPKTKLKLWLKQCENNRSQLHQIYEPILDQVFRGDEQAEFSQKLQFLGALILVATPLPAMSLAALLDIDLDEVNLWLIKLHAVLNIPSDPQMPIRPLHKSFSDFLLSPDDSGANIYRVDSVGIHTLLASKCIQLMTSRLKQDICNIQKQDAVRDNIDKNVIVSCISPELKYACLHWVHHLQGSGNSFTDQVYTFFYEHFLHWLEVLSLLGRLSDGTTAVRELLELIKHLSNTPLEFVDFVQDARRVISSFGLIIYRIPLQIYGTLLFFSPVASKVRQKFWSQRLPRQGQIQGIESDWNAHLQTISALNSDVTAVTFSPDGQILASASYNGKIRLLNATTGTDLQTLEGHSDCVNVVTFSHDSQFLASGSRDETVRVWSVVGAHQHTLVGHSSSIKAVSFSPDGQSLISVSSDHVVLHWSTKTGVQLKKIVGDYGSFTEAVALSADSQLIASAPFDHKIHIWNPATGLHKTTLKGHDDLITAVTFSPDNQYVASGSFNNTVWLWNLKNSAQKYILRGHSEWVEAIAFSSDSQLLASASFESIRLWDPTTGALQSTHDRFGYSSISAIALSPDSQLLASGSLDGTVRLFDITRLFEYQQSIDGHSDHVNAIVFSPNGQLVASASRDRTVQVWDASTGLRRSILRGHTQCVDDVLFSPDSKLLASDSFGILGAVRIWNVENGTHQQTLDDQSSLSRAVAYSTNGQLVAVGLFNNTIKLHSAITGAYMYTLEGHRSPVDAIIFSPDGQTLASSSSDGTIRLWNSKTGTFMRSLKGLNPYVSLITFSPDSQLIAVIFKLKGVAWWNAATGVHQQTLMNYDYISIVAFSPDARLLVEAVKGKNKLETINILEATTGRPLRQLQGYKGHAIDILFSPDSQLVAVASRDRTIRIWNVLTYECLHTLEIAKSSCTKIKFSPDGEMMASASREDKTIRLWSIRTGLQLQKMRCDKGFVREMTFLPGKLEVSVSYDELNWFWNLWNPMTLEFYSYPITDTYHGTPSDPVSNGASLDADKIWITIDSEKVLWIPPEYRPTDWDNKESTIFIGCESGQVIRFRVG